MPDWLDDFRQRGEDKLSLPPGKPAGARSLPRPTLEVLARLRDYFQAKGCQDWEAGTLALATLGELMRRKGGPVAMAGGAGEADELAEAVRLVKEVFGAEVETE